MGGLTGQQLFDNIPKVDHLNFWVNNEVDYNKVSDFLEFDKNELSKIGGISKQSVRLDHRIPQALKERLRDIALICALVAEYFEGDAQKTALWFKTSNPMLGDVTPRDMVRLGRAKKLIRFILEARNTNGPKGTKSAVTYNS